MHDVYDDLIIDRGKCTSHSPKIDETQARNEVQNLLIHCISEEYSSAKNKPKMSCTIVEYANFRETWKIRCVSQKEDKTSNTESIKQFDDANTLICARF